IFDVAGIGAEFSRDDVDEFLVLHNRCFPLFPNALWCRCAATSILQYSTVFGLTGSAWVRTLGSVPVSAFKLTSSGRLCLVRINMANPASSTLGSVRTQAQNWRRRRVRTIVAAMGIYAKYIFPRLLDWMLGAPELGQYRRRALAPAHGNT